MMNVNATTEDQSQIEISFAGNSATPGCRKRLKARHGAAWWFARMREAVHGLASWPSARRVARPEQRYLVLERCDHRVR